MDFVGIIDDTQVYSDCYCPQEEIFLLDGSLFWCSNAKRMKEIPKNEFCLVNPQNADNIGLITDSIRALKTKQLLQGNGNEV